MFLDFANSKRRDSNKSLGAAVAVGNLDLGIAGIGDWTSVHNTGGGGFKYLYEPPIFVVYSVQLSRDKMIPSICSQSYTESLQGFVIYLTYVGFKQTD